METIDFLNGKTEEGLSNYDALQSLIDHVNVNNSISEDYPRLVVLNYDHIFSPKFNPITQECRSLVLEMPGGDSDKWTLVSRSFDRFFNYGETECAYSASFLTGYEKLDGSIIGLFHYNGKWLYRTRSMIMPTSDVNGLDVTWDEIIEDALYTNGRLDSSKLTEGYTYILEVTAPENRIVVKYLNRIGTLLAVRKNDSSYIKQEDLYEVAAANRWNRPVEYNFEHMSDFVTAAAALPDLQEGFVLYDRHGAPACKVKNPTYVEAAHLKGETGLTYRRILRLIFNKEYEEYLSVFPEDYPMFEKYIKGMEKLYSSVEYEWSKLKDLNLPRKEFSEVVRKTNVSPVLYALHDGNSFENFWNNMTFNYKSLMLDKFI